MTQEGQVPPPPVLWAQRDDILFVTFCLEDCKDPVIKVEPTTVYFKGVGGTEQKMHELTINLYKEIDSDKTIQNLRERTLELILLKKEPGPYWPRLIKENTKAHWLKCDFNKWNDEDDSEDESTGKNLPVGNSDCNLQELMRQMGGLGGTGDSKPNFDDIEDSDDDDMPDLVD